MTPHKAAFTNDWRAASFAVWAGLRVIVAGGGALAFRGFADKDANARLGRAFANYVLAGLAALAVLAVALAAMISNGAA